LAEAAVTRNVLAAILNRIARLAMTQVLFAQHIRCDAMRCGELVAARHPFPKSESQQQSLKHLCLLLGDYTVAFAATGFQTLPV
jgi:hypothetical protein